MSVDLQKEFTRVGGEEYAKRSSTVFVREVLLPYLKKRDIRTAEIISDYRQPRPGDTRDICKPGQWGFESEISDSVRKGKSWIKCMNSPIWIRKGGGDPESKPGLPYQDPGAFNNWLDGNVGSPDSVDMIVLYGLTLGSCVLCTAQELTFRGYKVAVIYEATDTRSGLEEDKKRMISSPPLTYWTGTIHWKELMGILVS